MKKDSLKKLVSDNRDAFDRRIPDQRVWEAVREQLPKRKVLSGKIWWVAASVLVLLGVGGYLMIDDPSDQPNLFHTTPPLVELESKRVPDTAQLSAPEMARAVTTSKQEEVIPVEMEVYTVLESPVSVSNRLAGILELAGLPQLSHEQMDGLLEVINHDPSANVRMAALSTVAERLPETEQVALIQEVFVYQDDPTLQLELMLAMSRADSLQLNAATADRLYAITTDPLSLDFIKEHAYAVLMRSW